MKKLNISLKKDYNNIKLSVDTLEDFKNIKKVFKLLRHDSNFSYKDVIKNKKIKKLFNKNIKMKNILKFKNKTSQENWKKKLKN